MSAHRSFRPSRTQSQFAYSASRPAARRVYRRLLTGEPTVMHEYVMRRPALPLVPRRVPIALVRVVRAASPVVTPISEPRRAATGAVTLRDPEAAPVHLARGRAVDVASTEVVEARVPACP